MVEPSVESLPALDLSDPDRQANASKLVQIMEELGFVYMDNVPGYDETVEEELLNACKWFFALPLEEKLQVSPKKWNPNANCITRGYIPINVDQDHLREQYETGAIIPEDEPERKEGTIFYEPTPYPRQDQQDGQDFRAFLDSKRRVLGKAGLEFLRFTALGLGLPEDTFDSRFAVKDVSSLRLMHYPSYKETKGDLNTFTCEEHIDGSFVTFLVTFGNWGLEIEKGDGSWMKVPPRPGSLIVNIGRLLSRLTGGRLKATRHRVRDIGTDRYSMPFFVEPRADAVFHFPDDSSTMSYGEYMTEHMRRYPYQFGHVPDYKPITQNGEGETAAAQ